MQRAPAKRTPRHPRPYDPLVLTARCAVHTMSGQLDHAVALINRVLALEPAFVGGLERSGWVMQYGELQAAIEHFSQADTLDHDPPNASRLIGIGCAHFDAGRYEQAVLLEAEGFAATSRYCMDQSHSIGFVCSPG